MGLDGIAGRALGRRIGVLRGERKMAADNDNRQPELARAEGGADTPALVKSDRHPIAPTSLTAK